MFFSTSDISRDLFSLFPAAAAPYRKAAANRELWNSAHLALERRGRGNGVTR